MIVFIENPKKPSKQLLTLISYFIKFAGYKVNIKYILFLYYSDAHIDTEFKNIQFTATQKTYVL